MVAKVRSGRRLLGRRRHWEWRCWRKQPDPSIHSGPGLPSFGLFYAPAYKYAEMMAENLAKEEELKAIPKERHAPHSIRAMKKAGIHQVAIQPIVDNRTTLQSFSREIIKAMR
jgi:hypothetical protein